MHYYTDRELLARGMRPIARLILPPPEVAAEIAAMRRDAAEMIRRNRQRGCRFSALGTGTFPEVPPVLTNLTALANSTTETSLLTGSKQQPKLQPPMLDIMNGRAVRFEGSGIIGTTTGPPTITFKLYLNTTQGISTLGGTTIGATAAITTTASVSNKAWGFQHDLAVATPGDGSGNATLYSMGFVWSAAGFASPFEYTIGAGTGDSATVSVTLDGGQTQWFNISGTWSAASASNTIQLVQFRMTGWN